MRIIQLTAENVKRLHAVSITPDGSIVQITGRNGQGKTSVLDAITYALGGGKVVCSKPVRNGEAKAKIVCQLDDLTVTRTFTADGGGTLNVTNAEGARYPSPQAVLDKLVGKLTLDPLEFSRLPSNTQAETLRQLVGLDTTDLESQRAEAYSDRAAVNRGIVSAKANAESLPFFANAPKEQIQASKLIAELKEIEAKNAAADKVEQRAAWLVDAIENAEAECTRAGTVIHDAAQEWVEGCARIDDELKAELERVRAAFSKRRDSLALVRDKQQAMARDEAKNAANLKAKYAKELAELPADIDRIDTAEVSRKIAEADAINEKIRANARRAEANEHLREMQAHSADFTKQIEKIDAEKAALVAAVKFPIDGLGFDAGVVMLNGVPFDQASSAEKLKASVAIGLAMNPKLRVLLVRDGSLLDRASMEILEKIAVDHDAQIWIERVEEGSNVGIVIEDGSVKAQNADAELVTA